MPAGMSPENRRTLEHAAMQFAPALQEASAAIATFAMESRELHDARHAGRTLARQLCETALTRAMIDSRRIGRSAVAAPPSPTAPTRHELQTVQQHLALLRSVAERPGERAHAEHCMNLVVRSWQCRLRAIEAQERFRQLKESISGQAR